MAEQYSFPDFINFCANHDEAYRLDGEVFWYNRIPVPSVLIKKLFFSAHQTLKCYNSHLLSGITLSLHDLTYPQDKIFYLFPDPNAVAENEAYLRKAWENSQDLARFKEFESKLVSCSGVDTQHLSYADFVSCLGHKGKKYERLYYPETVRQLIHNSFPKVSEMLRRNNGDMFGNVIADSENIYRAGFGDAFAGIFNRYLDFKFDVFPNLAPQLADKGQVEIVSVRETGAIVPVDYAEGNLWEPDLEQGGKIGVQIDRNHPFNFLEPELKSQLLLLALANEEMLVFSESKKATIEVFRFKVSQTLRNYANHI